MKTISARTQLKVTDEAWIATVLLQREHPDEPDFPLDQIVQRAKQEDISKVFRPGVYVHAVQHCVANRPPNPGRYRMLFESAPGRRRLFRGGDSYHPDREGSKITPSAEDLPEGYSELLTWYREWNRNSVEDAIKNDPMLSLRGSGRHLWADEHVDEYVRRLREGWE